MVILEFFVIVMAFFLCWFAFEVMCAIPRACREAEAYKRNERSKGWAKWESEKREHMERMEQRREKQRLEKLAAEGKGWAQEFLKYYK